MGNVRSAARRDGTLSPLLAIVAALLLVSTPAQAQWGGEARMQLGFGGDEIVSVEYSDGSESGLDLGKYMSFSAGPIFELLSFGPSSIELQGLIGWASWSTGPERTDDRIHLTRIPVDALAFYAYHVPERDMLMRFGGGVTYFLRQRLKGTGSLDDYKLGVDDAVGYTMEVSAVFGTISTGLRYTQMDATVDGIPVTLDSSSLGLYLGFTTRRR